jgi:hypothetical protein
MGGILDRCNGLSINDIRTHLAHENAVPANIGFSGVLRDRSPDEHGIDRPLLKYVSRAMRHAQTDFTW